MKKIIILLILLIPFVCNAWEKEYIEKLEQGKNTNTIGLAYTPDETTVLEEAIEYALEEEANPCQVVKIAIDMEYNEFYTVKFVYSYGKNLNIDQICMCATEAGIIKSVIAKAAKEAINTLNEPIYEMDEIAQAQCITQTDKPLGYTEKEIPLTPIKIPAQPNKFSPSTF